VRAHCTRISGGGANGGANGHAGGGAASSGAGGGAQLSANVLDNGDGTYAVRWGGALTAGTYELIVTLDGTEVLNARVVVVISPARPLIANFTPLGHGMRTAVAGQGTTLDVLPFDSCGTTAHTQCTLLAPQPVLLSAR
jgi:hypothetical protein